jgi:hypothetical protein
LKVKISYTVELDDVPKQVYKFLINEKVSILNKDYDNLLKNIIDGYTEQAIAEIDTFRRNLALIDQRLDDAQSILDGYMKARYGSNVAESPDEQHEV